MEIEYVSLKKALKLLSEGKVRSIYHMDATPNMEWVRRQMSLSGDTMSDIAFVRKDYHEDN